MGASRSEYKIWQVIVASAVGTMIEWYDFYIFGSLATVISPLFYPKGNDTLALILSLPYHIGAGVFGGLLPLIGLYVVEATGDIYAGLYYPITVAAISFVVGAIFLKETHNVMIWREIDSGSAAAAIRREKVHQQTGV